MIALLDYGAGNVGSVLKAVKHLGYDAQPVDRPELLSSASKIILPGQGHFGQMMTALGERGLLDPVREMLAAGTPYLGICLGLQALYEGSEEAPEVLGLGLLPGRVKRFEGIFKVPHVGWSQLEMRHTSKLLNGVAPASFRLLLSFVLWPSHGSERSSHQLRTAIHRGHRKRLGVGGAISSGKIKRSRAKSSEELS